MEEIEKKVIDWNVKNSDTAWRLVKGSFYKFLKVYFILNTLLLMFAILSFSALFYFGYFDGIIKPTFNNLNNYSLSTDVNSTTNNQYSNQFDNKFENTYNVYLELSDETLDRICNNT